MREIKFRMWNKQHKEMYNDPINMMEEDSPINSIFIEDDFSVLMQYTGMNDRDGKYIYEGDILSQYFCDMIPRFFGEEKQLWDQGNHIGEVIYAKDCYRINDTTNETLHKIFKDCVVIGNIYENKDIMR